MELYFTIQCFFVFSFYYHKELFMKKLTGMMLVMVAAGVLLSGCYSKSCDTGCPAVRVATVKTTHVKATNNGESNAASSQTVAKAKAHTTKAKVTTTTTKATTTTTTATEPAQN
jgi:hypothetical protein